MSDNPLEFISLEDLLVEIRSRVNYGCIVLAIDKTEEREQLIAHSWGGVAAMGAAQFGVQDAKNRFGPITYEIPYDPS